MPTFTLELNEVVELSDGHIGLDDYPIFDESHRPTLNEKIIDHYWNQEIGLETISMFRLALKRRMNEIMPLYNKLYESEMLMTDPLFNMDIETDTETEGEQTGSANANAGTTANSKSRAVNSDTPQDRLGGNADYASSLADATSESSTTSTSEQDTVDRTTNMGRSRTRGTQGNKAELLRSYRQNLLNIDLMIIDELRDLFMMIWNTGDDYTGRTLI